MISNQIFLNYIHKRLVNYKISSQELVKFMNIFSNGEILYNLLMYPDILLIFLNFLSFDEIIDLSLINKSYYIKLVDIIHNSLYIHNKFLQRKPQLCQIYSNLHLFENSFTNKYIDLSNSDKFILFQQMVKYRLGDLIKSKYNYYFLKHNKLFLLNHNQDVYIYKELLDKYPLVYWEKMIPYLKIIYIFIDPSIAYLDFDNLSILNSKSSSPHTYLKVYHKKYDIFIVLYVNQPSNDKNKLIQVTKEKINKHSNIYSLTDNQKYFQANGFEKGNVKLSFKIDNPFDGWYLE